MRLQAEVAIRRGDAVTPFPAVDGVARTIARVKAALDAEPEAVAVVNTMALGAAVFDRLREMGCRVEGWNPCIKVRT